MQSTADLRAPWERTPPPVLYHYTSQEGLLGIIESKTLWASSIRYLNDYQEFLLGLKIAHQSLTKRSEPIAREVSSFIDGFKLTNFCVCSFSEQGDLLSQWRGYCPQGAGFSMGFDSGQLRSLAAQQGFVLGQCEYSPTVQRNLIEGSINAGIQQSTTGKTTDEYDLGDLIIGYSAAMKDRSFSEEREWRLISSLRDNRDPKFGFRKGQSLIIPYFKFNLADSYNRLPIKEIIVGPTPHRELAHGSIMQLVESKDIKCGVRHSSVPYRNW